MAAEPAGLTRVRAAAAARDLAIDIVEFPEGTRTAVDAAAAVGCHVDQIVKSMIFAADHALVCALTSGGHQVNPELLAAAIGATNCGRADPEAVRSATGFAIGGVSPLGQADPLEMVIDPHLLTFDWVWAAAGTPRHVFRIDPHELVQTTGASPAEFTH